MSLVDTLDSILMLYAYAQPDLRAGPERKVALFIRIDDEKDAPAYPEAAAVTVEAEARESQESGASHGTQVEPQAGVSDAKTQPKTPDSPETAVSVLPTESAPSAQPEYGGQGHSHGHLLIKVNSIDERAERAQRVIEAKTATISSLSISLTLLSILVALR